MKLRVVFFLICGMSVCCVTLYLVGTSSHDWLSTHAMTGLKMNTTSSSSVRISSLLSDRLHLNEDHLCEPTTTNIIYIKTHKSASTTLATILYRFGYQRNLSFVFTFRQPHGHFRQVPITEQSLSELYAPIGVSNGDYKHYKFNISAGHVIYRNHSIFDFLVPGHPKYITILREPVKQFVSFFNFFKFPYRYMHGVKLNLSSEDPFSYLAEFLNHPLLYGTHAQRQNRSIYITNRNPQFFDLGLPLQQMNNLTYINDLVTQVERDFDLVLLTEYLNESLVLLKKQFCWNITDILYFKMNIMHMAPMKIPEILAKKIQEWNDADVLLYKHFNRTLWRKIREYGPTFQADLSEFKTRLEDLNNECIAGVRQNRLSRYENILKANASTLCQEVNRSLYSFFVKITRKQEIPPEGTGTRKSDKFE